MSQGRVLSNIVSPYGLAIISFGCFLFACSLSPSVYTYYIHEPDLMFFDPATILFYSICVAAFLAGVWLISQLMPPLSNLDSNISTKRSPALFLLIPLVPCVLVTLLSSALLIKSNPLAIPILLAQEGNLLGPGGDASLDLHGTMNISVLFVAGVVWWSAAHYDRFTGRWCVFR